MRIALFDHLLPLPFALALTAACTERSPDEDLPRDTAAADTTAAVLAPPPPPTGAAAVDTPPADAPGGPPATGAAGPDSATGGSWTSRDTRVTVAVTAIATLVAVRTATHPEYDRIVFEFAGDEVPSHRLEYIDRPVRQCGSGDVVPLAVDAWLSIQFEPAQAHTDEGQATVRERSRSPRLPNLLELKLICDFEAIVEWVAAVASPEPYRLTTLRSPTRLVVDIRHPRRRVR